MTTNDKPLLSSWVTLSAIGIATIAFELGCGVEQKESPEGGETRDAFVGTLEDAWVVVDLQLAQTETVLADLHSAIDALVDDSTNDATRTTAQDAWTAAMTEWQKMEVMKMGAAGDSLKVNGGQDLGYEIYSWPQSNRCLVDQRTARRDFDASDFFEQENVLGNSYGLDALEVLLFSPSYTHDCPTNLIAHAELWDTLGESGVAQARADYSLRIVDQTIVNIEQIRSDWENGYGASLAQAGQDDSIFETDVAGLNAIFDALFYMEVQVKDKKIGWPLGLTSCGQADCTGKIESPLAGSSHLWLAANLAGFRSLYTGNDSDEVIGMHDFLVSLSDEGSQLADDVMTNLESAEAAVAGLDLPLNETIESDASLLAGVHAAVKGMTDLLKNDFPEVIEGLEIPLEASGDND